MPIMKWFLNAQMIAGAILGSMIGGGLIVIQDTWRHHGPGVIQYENGDNAVKVDTSKEAFRWALGFSVGAFSLKMPTIKQREARRAESIRLSPLWSRRQGAVKMLRNGKAGG